MSTSIDFLSVLALAGRLKKFYDEFLICSRRDMFNVSESRIIDTSREKTGVKTMAARKPVKTKAPERPALEALLEKARAIIMTDEQLREQRISFVYGNAPADSKITRESASSAITKMRLVEVH